MKRNTHERIARFNYVTICSLAAIFLLLVVYMTLGKAYDDAANHRFAEKARSLQLTGKPKAFLLSHFGLPDYTKSIYGGELVAYYAGPPWYLLRSECQVAIDSATGLVKGWGVNSE